MKREIIKILAVLSTGGVLLTGCVSHHAYRGGVVVTPGGEIIAEAPPSARVESPGPAPGAGYAWVPGYWTRHAGNWVWLPGHWELRPRAAATWVPGHWDHTVRGWVWTPGQWE